MKALVQFKKIKSAKQPKTAKKRSGRRVVSDNEDDTLEKEEDSKKDGEE